MGVSTFSGSSWLSDWRCSALDVSLGVSANHLTINIPSRVMKNTIGYGRGATSAAGIDGTVRRARLVQRRRSSASDGGGTVRVRYAAEKV